MEINTGEWRNEYRFKFTGTKVLYRLNTNNVFVLILKNDIPKKI